MKFKLTHYPTIQCGDDGLAAAQQGKLSEVANRIDVPCDRFRASRGRILMVAQHGGISRQG